MRIIVWGINYAPELTGIAPYNTALCEFLRAQGDDAEMLTTFAYYPTWRKQPDDRGRLYRDDVVNGVPVHRCWHYVPAKVAAWKRILHEGTFVLTSTLRGLVLPRADVYVIVSPPLLLGAAAWLVTKVKASEFVFHVQDLQPDAAVGLGMLRSGWFTRALYALEAFAYREARRVSGISRGMLDIFEGKGVPRQKLIYFPNGVRLQPRADDRARGVFRAKHGFAPNEFLAVYSGNLGVKQGLEILIDAAAQLQDSGIRVVICGDGAMRETLARRAAELQLPNVTMLPLQPMADYHSMLADADVCLITQQAGAGNAFFPSKLLSTLATARPVITVADADSELTRALNEGGFGVNVVPGDAPKLASTLRELASDPEALRRFGAAGREFVAQFEMETVLSRIATELHAIG
ncbi:MAG TPA: WcaI family glycosyltransferase [Chthoniobacterales bacterium]